ncbi:hypothetical protein SORBI_3004G276500 [Sorghum bicolor]|uniref:50S ribosomal protein L18 n=1 Tax=Sorghum bicolor TaxID=4558 RepID=A0A1Z5RPS1_SORBI|nr:hypothetical protein SORBI_3004G276500 [Sorghum bicolor]
MASLHPTTAMLPHRHSPAPSLSASSLSWSAAIAVSRIPPARGLALHPSVPPPASGNRQSPVVCAAWTRRSRGEAEQRPNRKSWKQRTDMTIGRLIAERSMDADVFALAYEPKKNERIEGKLGIVIDTIKEHGIIFV